MANDNEQQSSTSSQRVEAQDSLTPQNSPQGLVTPLPKLQITLTLLIQASEPITAQVIYPFIPEFIKRTGITGGDESKIGYYAGIIESLFFLSESLIVTHWGPPPPTQKETDHSTGVTKTVLGEVGVFPTRLIGQSHPSYKAKPSARGEEETRALLSEEASNSGYGSVSQTGPNQDPDAERTNSPRQQTYRSLLTPGLKATLCCQAFLALTDMCYYVLIPLIYSTSTHLGGLGFTPTYIGSIMAITMFINAMNQVTFSKWLLKRIGPRKMFILAYGTFFGDFIALMVLRMLVRHFGKVTPAVWVVIIAQQICSLGVSSAYTAQSILIVENAPDGALGSVNGLAQMISSGTRAFAPAFGSSLFALSLQSGILGGYLVDCILLCMTLVGSWCSLRLPRSPRSRVDA
ncbi:hypothetical protein PQX77_010216 [Marasmius sp. AFHP31]|nr:hypothetical protein PQX77_010216 [Marasmius sp. AFHP31]